MSKTKANKTDNTHVIKRGDGWAVKREGANRASGVYSTKEKAIKHAARDIKRGAAIIIHTSDGTVQEWMSN